MTKRHYLKKNNLHVSYLFAANFQKYNAETYGVTLRALKDQYDKIAANTTISEEERRVASAELELEVMAKLMELIESFAALVAALAGNETQIRETFVDFGGPQAYLQKFCNETQPFFYKVLTYPEIKTLSLTSAERRFLKRIYFVNIQFFKMALRMARDFYEKHAEIYNKHKHSRPLFIGMPLRLNKVYATSVIMVRHKKTKKIILKQILHSPEIMQKYIDLAIMFMSLQKDLLHARRLSWECRGFRHPSLYSYFEKSDHAKKCLNDINKRFEPHKDNINAILQLTAKAKKILKAESFYRGRLPKLKFGKDEFVEHYATKLT